MIDIQKYIKENGLERTIGNFSLNARYNSDGDRVHLSYDQINSFKFRFHPVCREARGIILSIPEYEVISFSFRRFFNLGEEEAPIFNFNNFKTFKKEDGSIMTLFFDKGKWYVKTSGTLDANCQINDIVGLTFKDFFWHLFGDKTHLLNESYCYVFELCSRNNKVVVDYPEPVLYLLTVRDKRNMSDGRYGELNFSVSRDIAKELGIAFVEEIKFNSLEEVKNNVKLLNQDQITDEGFVLVDDNFNRLKIKNSEYLFVHKIKGGLSKKLLFSKILEGEAEELKALFPEHKDVIKEMELLLENTIKKGQLILEEYMPLYHNMAKKDFFSMWNKKTIKTPMRGYLLNLIKDKKPLDKKDFFMYIAESNIRINSFIR